VRAAPVAAGSAGPAPGSSIGVVAECWRRESAVDCRAARMCLTHPTGAIRMAAVLRAVRTMRSNLAQPLSLTSLAHAALLSPYHFHRVFRHVTATTPARYLAALRMAEAKRLLACTSTSVTEIRASVGYASLGTFTSQFNRLVGTSPRTFRELMADIGGRPVTELLATLHGRLGPDAGGTGGGAGDGTHSGSGGGPHGGTGSGARVGPIGLVTGGPHEDALVLLGLFGSGVPQQRPAACAVATTPGVTRLGPVPDGVYHALAVGFDPSATVLQALADHRAPVCFVGASRRPVVVTDGRSADTFHVMLHRPRFTDAPVVLALPLLVAAELAGPTAR